MSHIVLLYILPNVTYQASDNILVRINVHHTNMHLACQGFFFYSRLDNPCLDFCVANLSNRIFEFYDVTLDMTEVLSALNCCIQRSCHGFDLISMYTCTHAHAHTHTHNLCMCLRTSHCGCSLIN
jgi:hypothetical protein